MVNDSQNIFFCQIPIIIKTNKNELVYFSHCLQNIPKYDKIYS